MQGVAEVRLLRVDGKPIDIEPYMGEILDCLRHVAGLAAVYLYGSYGTSHQTPLSDVDLALIFRPEAVPSLDEQLDIIGCVTDAARQDDVSVTVLNRASAPFQFRVLSTGRLIYCPDRVALADFVEKVLNVYGDFVIDYERFLREYDAALVERFGHE